MTDIDAQVAQLKYRIAQAQERQATARAQAALAQERATQAEQALREEFGISPSQAAACIIAREDDLAAEVAQVQAALERAEASSE